MKNILTIAIPTYNRHAAVKELIKDILENNVNLICDVFVFDDGSKCIEENNSYFQSISKNKNIKYIKETINKGYPFSLLRMFKECQTDYIMLMADDDKLISSEISRLLDYLILKNPDFLSTQYFLNQSKQLYRGRKNNFPINLKNFFSASAHAPGLVFKVDSCLDACKILESRLAMKSDEAFVYPQVVILSYLLLHNMSCSWYSKPITTVNCNLPSGILDSSGAKYFSVESRWKQINGFDQLFTTFSNADQNKIKVLRSANMKRAFGHLMLAMKHENPKIRNAFDKSATYFYLKNIIKSPLKQIINWLIARMPK